MGFMVHTAEPRRQVELVNLSRCSIRREAVFRQQTSWCEKSCDGHFLEVLSAQDQKEYIVSHCASPQGKGFPIFPWI